MNRGRTCEYCKTVHPCPCNNCDYNCFLELHPRELVDCFEAELLDEHDEPIDNAAEVEVE